jgi:hypothetical protein
MVVQQQARADGDALAPVAQCGERAAGGTLIPSRDAVVAYGVEGAEPAPGVAFSDSVPQMVRSLYRGVNGVVNPYSGFDAAGWPLDLQGWNGEESTLPQMVWETNASVVVEVGTFAALFADPRSAFRQLVEKKLGVGAAAAAAVVVGRGGGGGDWVARGGAGQRVRGIPAPPRARAGSTRHLRERVRPGRGGAVQRHCSAARGS